MAVSMNAGFMRSDYMISDAALPMRMEELEQLEQNAKFAEILGEFGDSPAKETPDASSDISTAEAAEISAETPAENIVSEGDADVSEQEVTVLSKAELKALARAVASGEMKLSEIPQELVSDVLLTVIAMMMLGVPEDEIPALQEASEISVTKDTADIPVIQDVKDVPVIKDLHELDALNTATAKLASDMKQELKTADKSAELYELVSALSELKPEEKADKAFAQTIEDVMAQIVQPEAKADAPEADQSHVTADQINFAQQVAQPATEIAAAPVEVTEDNTFDTTAAASEAVASVKTEVTAAVRTVAASTQQEQGNGLTQSGANNQTMVSEKAASEKAVPEQEFQQIRDMISDVRVTRGEQNKPETPTYTGSQTLIADDATKPRVVVKSDELMMLKNAAKPAAEPKMNIPVADTDSTQLMQDAAVTLQPVSDQLPVVFTRTDGTEVLVQPEEVLKQVTESIVQQATTSEGDTEYSITLTPEDLGNITVKLTKAVDGSLSVSIMADNAKTQRIIEENGYAIQNNLKQNGIELESWQTVNESSHEARAEDYSNSSRNPYYHAEENTDSEDEEDTSFAELISAM